MKKLTNKSNGILKAHDVSLNLLKANDFVAEAIRKEMAERQILLLNLVSSPGSGKTALLEETIKLIKSDIGIAVLDGDLETENDAIRIRKQGVQALQIVTGGTCHLEAQMIHQAMPSLDLTNVDILFIENVGNLVCPASYDLGEDIRVTLVSCTEGDDKPKKYPSMFLTTDVMVVSKTDLLPYVPFSVEKVIQEAKDVKNDIEVFELSSYKGNGMESWCEYLIQQLENKQAIKIAATN